MQNLQLGRTRLPICPTGPAIIWQPPGGELRVAGRISNLALAGAVGSAPMRLNASSMLVTQGGFNASNAALRLGKSRTAPVLINAASLRGNFVGSGATGTLSGGDAVIGTVPIKMSDIDGRWRFAGGGAVTIDGSMLVSDRCRPAQILSAARKRRPFRHGRQPDHRDRRPAPSRTAALW